MCTRDIWNLEYLATNRDPELFSAYIESSLGPERELYDEIQNNIVARGGEPLTIEIRMINSINNSCRASGKTIDQIDRRRAQWGVNLRERMKSLGKEDLYLSLQRIGSHPIHGTWIDLKLSHILEDGDTGRYRLRMKKRPDARLLTPFGIHGAGFNFKICRTSVGWSWGDGEASGCDQGFEGAFS